MIRTCHIVAGFCLAVGALLSPEDGLTQSSAHDKSLPIEITADSLEVAQEEQLATFEGNVDAVQGDLVLSAETLKVLYDGTNNDVGLAAGTGGTINQIEALGRVIISSPKETAEGDVGIYDVPAQLITLTGDVILTRGENVLRGEQLELDLATGKSRMVGTTSTETAEGDETSSGRVKALFTPTQKSSSDKNGASTDEPPLPTAKPE